jgi:predicted nucleic acid-binding protein
MTKKAFLDASFMIYLDTLQAKGDGPEESRDSIDNLYTRILKEYSLFSNVLTLDETIYIAKAKYQVAYTDSIAFLKRAILPFVLLVPIGLEVFSASEKYMQKYGIKPADSLHLASMELEGINVIVSEDSGFDRLAKEEGISRIWI